MGAYLLIGSLIGGAEAQWFRDDEESFREALPRSLIYWLIFAFVVWGGYDIWRFVRFREKPWEPRGDDD